MVQDVVRNILDRSFIDLRYRRLFEIDPNDITAVSLRMKSERMMLSKKDGQWNLEMPMNYPANPNKANALASLLCHLEASDFATSDAVKTAKNNWIG